MKKGSAALKQHSVLPSPCTSSSRTAGPTRLPGAALSATSPLGTTPGTSWDGCRWGGCIPYGREFRNLHGGKFGHCGSKRGSADASGEVQVIVIWWETWHKLVCSGWQTYSWFCFQRALKKTTSCGWFQEGKTLRTLLLVCWWHHFIFQRSLLVFSAEGSEKCREYWYTVSSFVLLGFFFPLSSFYFPDTKFAYLGS